MTTEIKDWRDALCKKLANLADSANIAFNDRNFIIRELYRLAEGERNTPVEQRIGALRVIEKANPKSLTQIFTKVKKFREVVVAPAYITVGPPSNNEIPDSQPAVKEPKPAPARNSVSSSQNQAKITYADAPLNYVYAMSLDSDYPVEGVLSTLSQFVMRAFPEPAKAAVVACVRAGLRYDLKVSQNLSAFAMLALLRSIPWIKDVSSKPPVLFGEVFIAID
jgi:hypothetical protein